MENTEIPEGTRIRIGMDEEPLVINQESLAEILALNSSQLEKKECMTFGTRFDLERCANWQLL